MAWKLMELYVRLHVLGYSWGIQQNTVFDCGGKSNHLGEVRYSSFIWRTPTPFPSKTLLWLLPNATSNWSLYECSKRRFRHAGLATVWSEARWVVFKKAVVFQKVWRIFRIVEKAFRQPWTRFFKGTKSYNLYRCTEHVASQHFRASRYVQKRTLISLQYWSFSYVCKSLALQ